MPSISRKGGLISARESYGVPDGQKLQVIIRAKNGVVDKQMVSNARRIATILGFNVTEADHNRIVIEDPGSARIQVREDGTDFNSWLKSRKTHLDLSVTVSFIPSISA